MPMGWLWYDRRARSVLLQVAFGLLLVGLIGLIAHTVSTNLSRLNMSAGFGFLRQHAGFQIGETLIGYDPSDSYLRAIMVGGLNTLLVSALSCVFATVIGTAVGVMRLAGSPLPRRLASCYVLVFRNTPLLLQMMLWYVVLQSLPPIRRAMSLGDSVFLSQRGLRLPSPVLHTSTGVVTAVALTLGALLVVLSPLHRRRRVSGVAGTALVLAGAAGLALSYGDFGVEFPVRHGFNFEGGIQLSPEFAAVLTGLVLYYAAYTAEIVRGGILAVSPGQWEAARAVGLSYGKALRHVVLPQALLVIIPPLTLEYVGIIKGSSIGILVGYPELFWAISAAIGQTGHAVEGVALLMAAYLVPSLLASTAMNAFNRRLVRRGVA